MRLAFLLLLPTLSACAADWPCWRGPHHDSTTAEASGWNGASWDLAGPIWSACVGQGSSSPVVADGAVYVIGWNSDADTVRALSLADGREIWRKSYRCPVYGRYHKGDESFYKGPSATPVFDRETGLLYTLSIDGNLRCWDAGDAGREVWGIDLYERFGVKQRPGVGGGLRDYGYTTCPMIHGEWLLVEVGASEGNLLAFDRRTGALRWSSACKDLAGHTGGPVPMVVDGIPCAVILTLRNLIVLRLDPDHAGQTLASVHWQTDYANNVCTPTVSGDSIIITSGYNIKKIARFDVSAAGIREVWRDHHYSQVCCPVIHEGRIYHAWQKLWCLDFDTGKAIWSGGRFGSESSCAVSGDGRLIILGGKKLALVETTRSPGEYRELAARPSGLKGRCWPHVTVADGRLLAKDGDGNLVCFDIGVSD